MLHSVWCKADTIQPYSWWFGLVVLAPYESAAHMTALTLARNMLLCWHIYCSRIFQIESSDTASQIQLLSDSASRVTQVLHCARQTWHCEHFCVICNFMHCFYNSTNAASTLCRACIDSTKLQAHSSCSCKISNIQRDMQYWQNLIDSRSKTKLSI